MLFLSFFVEFIILLYVYSYFHCGRSWLWLFPFNIERYWKLENQISICTCLKKRLYHTVWFSNVIKCIQLKIKPTNFRIIAKWELKIANCKSLREIEYLTVFHFEFTEIFSTYEFWTLFDFRWNRTVCYTTTHI